MARDQIDPTVNLNYSASLLSSNPGLFKPNDEWHEP